MREPRRAGRPGGVRTGRGCSAARAPRRPRRPCRPARVCVASGPDRRRTGRAAADLRRRRAWRPRSSSEVVVGRDGTVSGDPARRRPPFPARALRRGVAPARQLRARNDRGQPGRRARLDPDAHRRDHHDAPARPALRQRARLRAGRRVARGALAARGQRRSARARGARRQRRRAGRGDRRGRARRRRADAARDPRGALAVRHPRDRQDRAGSSPPPATIGSSCAPAASRSPPRPSRSPPDFETAIVNACEPLVGPEKQGRGTTPARTRYPRLPGVPP